MNYRAIVFDYGGVLVVNGIGDRAGLMADIGEVLGVSGEEFRAEYFKHNHLTNVDGLPWIEACLSAVRVFDDSAETEAQVRKVAANFNNSKRLNTELIDVLPKLKAAGYMVAILSNYTTELREVLREQNIDHHFDHIFVSGEIGFQKPDPQAFQVVLDTLEIEPSEMVFIDDTERSLETADAVGYQPILFTDNEAFFKEFERLGVLA